MKKENKKFIKLFLRCSLKYFGIVVLFCALIIPIIVQNTYDSRKEIISNSQATLIDGLDELATEIIEMQELARLITADSFHTELTLLKGVPETKLYPQIRSYQLNFEQLCRTKSYIYDAGLLYRDNPVMISNFSSTPDYRSMYPTFFSIGNISAEEWRDQLFGDNRAFHFIKEDLCYSGYLSNDHNYSAITCVLNTSYAGTIGVSSILYFTIPEELVTDLLLSADVLEESWLVIRDIDGKPLLEFANEKVDDEGYIQIETENARLGLSATIGISQDLFNQKLKKSIQLLQWYALFGLLLAFSGSLWIAMKETRALKKVLDYAEDKGNISFWESGVKDEYSYLKQVFQTHADQLNSLHAVTRVTLLESLLLGGSIESFDREKLYRLFQNRFEKFSVAVLILSSDTDLSVKSALILELKTKLETALGHEIILVCTGMDEYSFLIFSLEKETDISEISREVGDAINLISQAMKYSMSINIGMSGFYSEIESIREGYVKARDTMNLHFDPLISGVYLSDQDTIMDPNEQKLDVTLLLKLYDGILSGNKESVSGLFQDVFDFMNHIKCTNQVRQQYLFSVRLPIYNALQVIQNNSFVIIDPSIIGRVEDGKNWESIVISLRDSAFHLCDLVENNRRIQRNQRQDDILEYIQKNYTNSLMSAALISEEMQISEKYVFTIVKELTGKTLGKYIETLRIESAEALLLSSNMTNSEIADECGFGSVHSFYRSFSKKHGKTPAEWKEQEKIRKV